MNVISGERAQTQIWYEIYYLDQFGYEHTFRVDDPRHAEMVFDDNKADESIIGLTRIEKTPLRLKRWGTEWTYENENLSG